MARRYLAADLGAESGRVILGTIEGGRLELEELHRCPNIPVRLPTGLYWDTLRLWHEILGGLAVAGRDRKLRVDGIGVDTWGVDFAFLGSNGALVDNPRHYRDARNNGMLERTFAVVPREEIFEQTGIQFMQLNSLYQWHAMKLSCSSALAPARTLLFMPDLFNYYLSGVKKSELTIASTSQFYDPRKGQWAAPLLDKLGLDRSVLPGIVPPGTRLGPILPYVAEATQLDQATPVFATGCHDTASAVAAAPLSGDDSCYISSGTWSLMGVETHAPVINARTLELNFTNEAGAGGRIRLLKNIMGLWPLQECRRQWAIEGRDYGYDELTRMAAAAPAFAAVINPDAFLEPGNMPRRIAGFCARTGQKAPDDVGGLTRVILESLALRYRQVAESLEAVTGKSIRVIHIVGGGSRNTLLNQLAADCTGRKVIAGPSEATAAGNVLLQAMGAGDLAGLDEIRNVVRESFPVSAYEPKPDSRWEPAYGRFREVAFAAPTS